MNAIAVVARILLMAALAIGLAIPAVRAENFPTRPIHLILPYAPGGIIEFVGRRLAQKLGEVLGKPVVVEDRPGAGSIVGVNTVAHSAPDGYAIVLVDPAIVTNPTLHRSLPYDTFKDLVAISIVATAPEVLVVAPKLGIKTQAALVAYGKANPGKLNYASAGIGSLPHLAAEMWKARTGIEATHVPYQGIGPAFIDLMSGKVQMSFASLPAAMPFLDKGSLVPLATTGRERSTIYPDLPTVSELLPGYEGRPLARRLWHGRDAAQYSCRAQQRHQQGAAGQSVEDNLCQIRHCPVGHNSAGRWRIYQGRIREVAQNHRRCPHHAGLSSDEAMTTPWPTELRLRKDRKALAVTFDNGESFELAAEYLRVRSPSAEVKGHSPSERRTVAGKENVQILELHPVGNYAIRLVFDDMHSTGIFSWDYLFELGRNHEQYWRDYLAELAQKSLSRASLGR